MTIIRIKDDDMPNMSPVCCEDLVEGCLVVSLMNFCNRHLFLCFLVSGSGLFGTVALLLCSQALCYFVVSALRLRSVGARLSWFQIALRSLLSSVCSPYLVWDNTFVFPLSW
jgi:hypothetical protein